MLLGLQNVAVGDVDVEARKVAHCHATIGLFEELGVQLDLLVVAQLHEPRRVVGRLLIVTQTQLCVG